LLTELTGEQAALGFTQNGYQHIKEVSRLKAGGTIVDLIWRLGKMKLLSEIVLSEGQQLYIARTFGNPASEFRRSLIIRQIGCRAEFKMKWKILE